MGENVPLKDVLGWGGWDAPLFSPGEDVPVKEVPGI